jgi:membrane protein
MSAARAPLRRHHRIGYRLREFLRRLGEKCADDEILYMASAISFQLVVALFPLLILGIGITGYALSRFGDPTQAVLNIVIENLPQASGADLTGLVRELTEAMLRGRAGYTIVGSVVLLWIAMQLSASLRVTLREIFDIGQKRSFLGGKLFGVTAVFIGFTLLTLNLGATVIGGAVMERGVTVFGVDGATRSAAEWVLRVGVALGSIWVLLLLAYRYMPDRPVHWRTAVVGATFTAVSHESLKLAFSWYATEVADFGSAFGNLATVAVLFLWIYYESLVFILGGEVAQVYTMRRASRLEFS